jgi:hypothetical protein
MRYEARLGFPVLFWCSDPRRFYSLSRSEHVSEHPDLISEHVSTLSGSRSKPDSLTDA